MNRFTTALLLTLVAPVGAPAIAQAAPESIARNAVLWDAAGKRIGKVARVHDDGSVSLIVGEKLVRVPSSTLTNADGKLTTSMTYKDLRRS